MADLKETHISCKTERPQLCLQKWGFTPLTEINVPTSARPKSYIVVGVTASCLRVSHFRDSSLVWQSSEGWKFKYLKSSATFIMRCWGIPQAFSIF